MQINKRNIFLCLCLFFIALMGIICHWQVLNKNTNEEDIYYIWLEGKRILAGENPYLRILAGNMRDNDKYATYFPLFYWLAALTQFIGFRNYPDWLSLWRPIFLIFNFGVAGIIYHQMYKYKMAILGLFAILFWLFSRWSLYVTSVAQIDFIPIFLMVASLVVLPKRKYLSFLLFSFSLAIKQIDIFLIPLYLIYTVNLSQEKIKAFTICLLIIISVPLLTSLPFIFDHAEAFGKSILFSATRNPSAHIDVPSLDVYIGRTKPSFVGIPAKIPMLMMMALIYLSAFKQQIGIFTSVLLTMFTFLNFNSVLFIQYFAWIIPLIPLSICDFKAQILEKTHKI